MAEDWTHEEVQLIIGDYFAMLEFETYSIDYSKTDHRTALLQKIKRSKGSIEFKHQNISAVLVKMDLPFIKGYKPKFNYQEMLAVEVGKYLQINAGKVERTFRHFSEDVIVVKTDEVLDFSSMLDNQPLETVIKKSKPKFTPIKINYLEREQSNKELGDEGEKLVVEYERWRLTSAGKPGLADKIEWIAKDKGDGTGYDILSKDISGSDRFIEVKTTKLPKETPFFVTENEIEFASLKGCDFFLYRVYNLGNNPKIIVRQGDYSSFCKLQPTRFKGYL